MTSSASGKYATFNWKSTKNPLQNATKDYHLPLPETARFERLEHLERLERLELLEPLELVLRVSTLNFEPGTLTGPIGLNDWNVWNVLNDWNGLVFSILTDSGFGCCEE